MGLRGIAFVLKAETGGQELGSDRVSRRTKNLVVKLALGRLRNNVVSSGPTPFLLKQRVVQTVTRGSHGREPERAGHPEPLPEPPKIEKENAKDAIEPGQSGPESAAHDSPKKQKEIRTRTTLLKTKTQKARRANISYF